MSTVRKVPAFRLSRGDEVLLDRRRWTVARVGLVARIPRRGMPRQDPLLRFVLDPAGPNRGRRRTVDLEQYEQVRRF